MKIYATLLATGFMIHCASAQLNLGQKIKDKVTQRADAKVDQTIDKGLDKTEEEAEKSTKTKTKTKTENGSSKTKVKTKSESDDGASEVSNSENIPSKPSPALASYSKFDFVPGEKVIFFDDFASDNLGDFPVKWNTNGNGEVVTNSVYPGKWLKMRNSTTYLPEITTGKFPENYTIEYDMVASGEDRTGSFYLELTSLPNKKDVPAASDPTANGGLFLSSELLFEGNVRYMVRAAAAGNGYNDPSTDLTDQTLSNKANEKFHVSIAVNKTRFRYYVNETKVLDLPRIMPVMGINSIVLRMWGWTEDHPFDALISNFRYAEGVVDVRSKLMTEGKFVTRGILFDVNSDKIKPESNGALKEIAQVLKDNPAVKVKIIGHTDNDGNAASNIDLSKRRAAAVRTALSGNFGIEIARMMTDGKGASEPASPNTSPEGKANNRRVEFIKL